MGLGLMSERLQSDPATIRAAMGWECTVRDDRAAMDDDTFWSHVAVSMAGPGVYDIEHPYDIDAFISNQGDPCPECGEMGACGYDSEGRAMVHIVIDDDMSEEDDQDD